MLTRAAVAIGEGEWEELGVGSACSNGGGRRRCQTVAATTASERREREKKKRPFGDGWM